MRGLIVFDGDDTLWRVEHLYDEARERAAAVAAEAGLDPGRWAELQKKIDVANVAHFGLSRERFPQSSVLAYEHAAAGLGICIDAAVKERIRAASASVFDVAAPLVPGVLDVLDQLRETHRLALLTQGDPVVQEKRIAHSGLCGSFEIIHVVEHKDERAFMALLADAGIEPPDAWSVGNSFPSDVDPALRLDMSAVWIETHVWAHERRRVSAHARGRLFVCDELRYVPAVVAGHVR